MFIKDDRIVKKIQGFLENKSSGEQLYLIALVIFLTSETLTTTMFSVPGIVYALCKMLTILFVAVKVLLFDQYQRRTLILCGIAVAVSVLVFVSAGYTEPLMWIVVVIGAKDVPLKKILQAYLIVAFSIVLLAFSASLLDVIENLQYESDTLRGVRNSFGILYTTDFASHIFSLMLVFFYLMREKLKAAHYIIGIVIAALVFEFCNARLDVGCMLILIIVFAVLNRKRKAAGLRKKYGRQGKGRVLFLFSMPVAAVFITAVTLVSNTENPFWNAIDELLSNRLSLAQRGLEEYGISLFGQTVNMVGWGGTMKTLEEGEYFFVDSSYLYILLRYGIIFLLIVLGIYVKCCKKYKNDSYFLAAVALVSLNCMIAHHLIELAYNPFALALLAKGFRARENGCRSGGQGEGISHYGGQQSIGNYSGI